MQQHPRQPSRKAARASVKCTQYLQDSAHERPCPGGHSVSRTRSEQSGMGGGGGGGGRPKGGWVPLMGAQRPFWKVAQACGAGHVMSPQVAA